MSSPTARSLAECRNRGWTAQVVEKWQAIPKHPGGGVRIDLFDVIDLVAITESGILGIQACAMASRTARVAKCHTSVKARAWIRAGGRLEVWGWRKLKVKRGGKLARWTLDVTPIELTDNAMCERSVTE